MLGVKAIKKVGVFGLNLAIKEIIVEQGFIHSHVVFDELIFEIFMFTNMRISFNKQRFINLIFSRVTFLARLKRCLIIEVVIKHLIRTLS